MQSGVGDDRFSQMLRHDSNNNSASSCVDSSNRSRSARSSSSSRADLSRELLHRLRSMTETIKLLSAENEALRATGSAPSSSTRRLSALSRVQLESLVLTKESEMEELKVAHNLRQQSALKYKALARRLKEERDRFKDNCHQQNRVESELSAELNAMAELVSALRADCESLRSQLSNKEAVPINRTELCSIGTQTTTVIKEPNNKGQRRSTSLQRKKPAFSVAKQQYSPMVSPTPSRRAGSCLGSASSSRSRLSSPRITATSRPGSASGTPNSPGPKIVKPVLPRASSASHVANTTPTTTAARTITPAGATLATAAAMTTPVRTQVSRLPCSSSRIPSRTPASASRLKSGLGNQHHERRVASEDRSKPTSLTYGTDMAGMKSGISRLSPAARKDRSRTWKQYYHELESRGQTSEATSSSFEEPSFQQASSMPSRMINEPSVEVFSSGDEDDNVSRLASIPTIDLEANDDLIDPSINSIQTDL